MARTELLFLIRKPRFPVLRENKGLLPVNGALHSAKHDCGAGGTSGGEGNASTFSNKQRPTAKN